MFTLNYIKSTSSFVTVPPSQSCGAVPLNDPFKTSTPARFGKLR